MRSRVPALLVLAILLVLALSVSAQQRDASKVRPSPNATVTQAIGVTDVTLTYGRPGVKGRDPWGTNLAPLGKVWRTGANEATTITFSNPVSVEGHDLPAGTYGLFTIPGKSEWTIIFNKTPNQWGAFNYDPAQDILRVKVKPQPAPHTEWFLISFRDLSDTSAAMVLAWEKVSVPVKIQTRS